MTLPATPESAKPTSERTWYWPVLNGPYDETWKVGQISLREVMDNVQYDKQVERLERMISHKKPKFVIDREMDFHRPWKFLFKCRDEATIKLEVLRVDGHLFLKTVVNVLRNRVRTFERHAEKAGFTKTAE